MSRFPKAAVVILNWNGQKYLEQFLPSVLASTYPNLEIIVADNASSDNSVRFVKKQFPSVRIIENEDNFGFAGGYNAALKQVEADYYILLNSDVEVTPDWIEPMIALLESDEKIAAAQPKLKDWNDRDLFEYAGAAGGFIDKFGYPFCRGRIFDHVEADQQQYDSCMEVFWASGAALFIRSLHWKEAGGFDSDFFAHMEEIDLCWRLKNLGYKIMCCPSSTVYHIGGGTLQTESPYKTYLNYRNNLLMLLKNLPSDKKIFIIFIRFWLDFISLLKFLLEGKFSQVRAINKAHTAFFKDLSKHHKKSVKDTSRFNASGYYNGSIVWQYFGRKIRVFTELSIHKKYH